MISLCRLAAVVTLAAGLALAVGAASVGCGPKQKFCPDAGDGVCVAPVDAPPRADIMEAPEDKGSTYIGADAADAGTP
jgi:hypothetical protein